MKIYTNSITNAVFTILSSWEPFVNSGTLIEQFREYNTDPNKTPWIGVYSPFIVFDLYRANIISPFMATYNIPIISQVAIFRDIEEGAQLLAELSGEIYTAVSCYRNLLNTVEIIKGITIDPYNRYIEEEDNLFADRITIIAEVFA